MTREEKEQFIREQIYVSGMVLKLIRQTIEQSIPSLSEADLDRIITALEVESPV